MDRREEKQGQVCFFFPLYSFQAFSNVILMLLLEVWLAEEKGRNEGTVQPETLTEGVLRYRKMEGQREAEIEGVIERERAKQPSLFFNGGVLETSLPHVQTENE